MRQLGGGRWARRSRRAALLIRLAPVAVATVVAVPVLVTSSSDGPVPLAVVAGSPLRVVAAAPAAQPASKALAFKLSPPTPIVPVAHRLADPTGFVAAAIANARSELNARAQVDAAVKAEAAAAIVKPTVTAKPKVTTTKPRTPTPTTRSSRPVPKPKVAPATTVPIPVTAAPPVPVQGPYTQDQVIGIIRSIWPADLADKAIAIARRESNLIPTAHNWCCTGLFQIYAAANASTIAALGFTASQLTDPTVNSIVAYAMYQRAGWAPWGF